MNSRTDGIKRGNKGIKMVTSTRDATITTHRDGAGGNEHLAINVKYHGPFPTRPNDATEETWNSILEAAWERTTGDFWDRAADIAHQFGYSGVFSEGRSGGWLVPYTQHRPGQTTADRHWVWPGQGPDRGWLRYPDPSDHDQRSRFAMFKTDIDSLMSRVGVMLTVIAQDMLDTQRAYPA